MLLLEEQNESLVLVLLVICGPTMVAIDFQGQAAGKHVPAGSEMFFVEESTSFLSATKRKGLICLLADIIVADTGRLRGSPFGDARLS